MQMKQLLFNWFLSLAVSDNRVNFNQNKKTCPPVYLETQLFKIYIVNSCSLKVRDLQYRRRLLKTDINVLKNVRVYL